MSLLLDNATQDGACHISSDEDTREVKRRHSLDLRSRPGVCVVGVEGYNTGQFVLTVHLDTDDPEVRRRLPDHIDGYPVTLAQSEPFREFGSRASYTAPRRFG